jgi:hypothetical protein
MRLAEGVSAIPIDIALLFLIARSETTVKVRSREIWPFQFFGRCFCGVHVPDDCKTKPRRQHGVSFKVERLAKFLRSGSETVALISQQLARPSQVGGRHGGM